jgi:hypothetical protein
MLAIRKHVGGKKRDRDRGTWNWTREGDVNIKCPECGLIGSLMQHDVDHLGNVTPEVVCPGKDCSFRELVALGGWRRP